MLNSTFLLPPQAPDFKLYDNVYDNNDDNDNDNANDDNEQRLQLIRTEQFIIYVQWRERIMCVCIVFKSLAIF